MTELLKIAVALGLSKELPYLLKNLKIIIKQIANLTVASQ